MKNLNKFIIFSLHLITLKSISSEQCFGKNEKSEDTNGPIQSFQQVLYDRQLEFSLNLFHKLYNKNEGSNLFFSPHSIHQALMLSLFGAAGETEKQLRSGLELSPTTSKTELLSQYKMEKYFMEARQSNTTQYTLKIANKIFASENEPVRPCVLEILSSEIERLDFANKSEDSTKYINDWVEKSTEGKIKDIIPPGVINPTTRLAIANSAYFKGSWDQAFKKQNTKLSLFYISQKEVTQTYMMHQKGSFRHGASELLKAYVIELPYEGEAMSMYILLPPFTPDAITETIERLNASSLRQAIDSNALYHGSIDVALPRFKIEQSFELNNALSSIGITNLFSNESDLSELSEDGKGLSIGTALHKSFVEVNEEGSEAAASTVLIDTRSGRPLDETRFICNHPFIFFIHDNAANTVLFMGLFKNPKHAASSMSHKQ